MFLISRIINKTNNLFLRKIDKSVHFTGKKYIEYGKNTVISQNTWLNVNKRENQKRIILGDYNFIGRNNFFSSGEIIKLGDFVITSVNCNFIGAQHMYENPTDVYIFSSSETDNTINIGHNCFIGANVTLMGNVNIGMGSIIGVNSFIRNITIPPFSVVVGSGDNARIIKRFSFVENKWKKNQEWNDIDEKSIPSDEEYLTMLYINLKNKIPGKINMPLKAAGKSNKDLYY